MNYTITISILIQVVVSTTVLAQLPVSTESMQRAVLERELQSVNTTAPISVATAPSPHFSIPLTVTLPEGYPNKGVDGQHTVQGTAYVYTKDAGGKIKKPIIIPEPFDPINERGWDSLYNRL